MFLLPVLCILCLYRLCDDLVGRILEIIMDKNWIHMHTTLLEYRNSELIMFPCNKCKVSHNRCSAKEVAQHLMFNDFWPCYKEWVHHGKKISGPLFIFL